MNERLKTHSKTQKKSADLVSNKLRIGVFQRYQMKCKSVSKKSPRYTQLGLPFAFASHFAPDMLFQALHLYRSNFKPSARLEKPYAMVCINIIAADSNRDAEFLFTSMQQAFVKLRRGETGQLPPPIQNMDQFWSPSEQYGVQQALSMSLVGDKAKVRHGLQSILRETDADEIMVNGQIFDHQARLHSFELAMDVKEELLG